MVFLSVAELAEQSGRHEKTIRRAITSGRLPADVDEVTGQYRIASDAAFALYPPVKHEADAPETPEIEQQPEIRRDPAVPPPGWHEGFSDGQLDACRAIVELDCSEALWAALRAILL